MNVERPPSPESYASFAFAVLSHEVTASRFSLPLIFSDLFFLIDCTIAGEVPFERVVAQSVFNFLNA